MDGIKKQTPQERYAAKTLIRIVFNLNRNTDPDIIDHISRIDNKQGYIKALIRADMANTIGKAGNKP